MTRAAQGQQWRHIKNELAPHWGRLLQDNHLLGSRQLHGQVHRWPGLVQASRQVGGGRSQGHTPVMASALSRTPLATSSVRSSTMAKATQSMSHPPPPRRKKSGGCPASWARKAEKLRATAALAKTW